MYMLVHTCLLRNLYKMYINSHENIQEITHITMGKGNLLFKLLYL